LRYGREIARLRKYNVEIHDATRGRDEVGQVGLEKKSMDAAADSTRLLLVKSTATAGVLSFRVTQIELYDAFLDMPACISSK